MFESGGRARKQPLEPAEVELGSQIETRKMGGGTAGLHWREAWSGDAGGTGEKW